MLDKVKFSTQADPEVLNAMKTLAKDEGRQLQAIIDEAMRYYLKSREMNKIRPSALMHFQDSVERNKKFLELLAK